MVGVEELFVSGLVYDYLLKKDASMAMVFQRKTKAVSWNTGTTDAVRRWNTAILNTTWVQRAQRDLFRLFHRPRVVIIFGRCALTNPQRLHVIVNNI